MKKLLFTFLLGATVSAFAQTESKKPLYVVDGVIASEHMFKEDKKNIQSMDVYKPSSSFPAEYKSYEGIAKQGLISVKVKENYYDKISLAKLNIEVGLSEGNPAYIDGNLISDSQTIVFGNILENYSAKDINGKKMLVIESTPALVKK